MAPASGFRAFLIIYCGQFVSLVGSAMAGFALTVYLYQVTGSVTTLGLAVALFLLPMIVVSPIGGSLVDRYGARHALLLSSFGSTLVVVALAVLMALDAVALWHVYAFVALTSGLRALQIPAFDAAVPLLVPKRHLGRANGLRLVATAASETLAPLSAGFLLLAIDIEGILLMNSAAFAVAILALVFVRIPRVPQAAPTDGGQPSSARFGEAWRYVSARSGLLALLGVAAVISLAGGFVDLLHTPLVLDFASPEALGTVLTIGGLGAVLTSVALSVWGGPRNLVGGVLGFGLVMAASTVLAAVRPSIPLIAVSAFLFLGSSVIVAGCVQTLWQTKIDQRLLGRAMALKNMVLVAPQLAGVLAAGPVADALFTPLVGRDRVRSAFLATLVGDGRGRGIALLLMVLGILVGIVVVAGYLYPRLRMLEEELPDTVPEAAAQPVATAPSPAPAGTGIAP